MGEARARALQAWNNSVNSRRGVTPPASVLYQWRVNHPKGRGFSCYQHTLKVSIKQMIASMFKREV